VPGKDRCLNLLHPVAQCFQLRSQPAKRVSGQFRQLCFNISLLTRPPYSPELKPVENIWQFLRQNHLSNRVFATYDAIVDACCQAWNALTAQPDRIQSISTRSWM